MYPSLLPCIAVAGLGAIGGVGFERGPGPDDQVPGAVAVWTESSMKHRGIAEFDFALGKETWKDVGSEIDVLGVAFPVEFEQAMKFVIDSNGDGKPDRDIKGQTGYVELKGKNAAGEVFHYGVRFENKGERKYSWAASGAMVGRIGGQAVSIIDANANGRYDDYGTDGLVIGTGIGAGYVSRVVNLGGDLFDFEVSADGTTVKTRPYGGETGTLKLGKLGGLKADVANAIFTSGREIAFQVAGETRGLAVPVGDYRLDSALLKRRAESARVRSGRMPVAKVTAGLESLVNWGGPLTGEVPAPRVHEGNATLNPAVKVFGQAGEEYYDFQPKGKVPSYELFDANTGKRLAKGKFPAG